MTGEGLVRKLIIRAPPDLVNAVYERDQRSGGPVVEEDSMEAQIGGAAGVIWQYLDENSEATVRKLQQATKLSDQLLFMGLGWLAREEKLNFLQGQRTLKVSLRER